MPALCQPAAQPDRPTHWSRTSSRPSPRRPPESWWNRARSRRRHSPPTPPRWLTCRASRQSQSSSTWVGRFGSQRCPHGCALVADCPAGRRGDPNAAGSWAGDGHRTDRLLPQSPAQPEVSPADRPRADHPDRPGHAVRHDPLGDAPADGRGDELLHHPGYLRSWYGDSSGAT